MSENVKNSILILTVMRELSYALENHYSSDVRAFCLYLLDKVENEIKEWCEDTIK